MPFTIYEHIAVDFSPHPPTVPCPCVTQVAAVLDHSRRKPSRLKEIRGLEITTAKKGRKANRTETFFFSLFEQWRNKDDNYRDNCAQLQQTTILREGESAVSRRGLYLGVGHFAKYECGRVVLAHAWTVSPRRARARVHYYP